MYTGATATLIAMVNTSAVPTAAAGGWLKTRMSSGAVSDPAPTPVRPTAAAMRNPSRNVKRAIIA